MFDCYVRFLECTISSLSTTMQGKNHKFGLFAKNITGLHRLLNGKVLHFCLGGDTKKAASQTPGLVILPLGSFPQSSMCGPWIKSREKDANRVLYHSFTFKWVESFQIIYVNLCFMSNKSIYHFKIIILSILKDPILDLRLIPWLRAWTHIVERACPMESRYIYIYVYIYIV